MPPRKREDQDGPHGGDRAARPEWEYQDLNPRKVPPVALTLFMEGEEGRQQVLLKAVTRREGAGRAAFAILPVGLFRFAGDDYGWIPDQQVVDDTVEAQLSVGVAAVQTVAARTPCAGIFIKPLSTNLGRVHFKVNLGSTITTANSAEVPTAGLFLPINDVSKLWFIASVAAQTLTYSYIPLALIPKREG